MTLPGPNSEQTLQQIIKKHELSMKWAAMAPIWLRIGVSSIVFREESEYGTPGAQF